LEDLFKRWEEFPVADPPKGNELPLEDELIGLLMEILTSKLTGAEGGGLLPVELSE
jgi:hypothetical protein